MRCKVLLGVLTYLTLAGCEAPLVLDDVEQARKQAIHRTDRIQAAASLGDKVLLAGIGFILNSNDRASTWKRTQPVQMPSFIGAAICPNGLQAAVSAEKQVWISIDNGEAWQINDLNTDEAPQFISCGPNNKLWVAASFSTLFSSEDGGEKWKEKTFDEDLIFTYIKFFDQQNGVIVGEFGSVYTTEDGGETWMLKEQRVPNEFFPLAVSYLDRQHGWIGGSNGVIFHTDDGGNTWEKEQTGSMAPIYGLSASALGVYAVGDFGTFLERRSVNNEVAKWGRSTLFETRSYLRALAPLGNDGIVLAGGAGTLQVLRKDSSGKLVVVNKGEK